MTALADLGLVDAAGAVTRREVSSVALLDACLARLDAVNKTINAAKESTGGELNSKMVVAPTGFEPVFQP